MADGDKVKLTLYFTPETWDRLIQFIRDKYGRDVKATSITVEAAVKEYLDNREAPVSR